MGMAEQRGVADGRLSPGSSALLTFLIADIRGYTRFSAERGDVAAAQLSERFLSLSEEVVAANGGEVFGSAGDQALAAFPSAHAALRAAVALQSRLEQEQGAHPDLALRAGIGLDTGEGIRAGHDYRGNAVNRAARLSAIAGGGDIFASENVLAVARVVEGVATADRGLVVLKGLRSPVRVFQIGAEGRLPEDLPPLQPSLASQPTNLPTEPTPFVGRELDINQVATLLRDRQIRLVTLTGPGGSGKTRLAIQVGYTLLYDYQDGVFFCDLSSLTDPGSVPSAVAEALSTDEESGKEVLTILTEYLRNKHLLLILDNVEHLLDAAPVVALLLDNCHHLRVLSTSRSPLHLARENEYIVGPLSVPDAAELLDLDAVSRYEAVALFVNRAKAVRADFELTSDNAPAVVEICARLDGLPLAIELAAARIKLFPPQALLRRLSSALSLLTGGARDRPDRQRTLRGAIDWSYSLLTPKEQILFARLSVFAGGCTLEAVEEVCDPEGELDLLEGMTSLVDKSVLRTEGQEEPRFLILQTIREYAEEKLQEQGDGDKLRRRHADYYLSFVNPDVDLRSGALEKDGLVRIEREYDNLRGAIRWALDSGESETAVLLALGLNEFWLARGYFSEAQRWLEAVLDKAETASIGRRADAYDALGWIAHRRGNFELARASLKESLRLSKEAEDPRRIAKAVSGLGMAFMQQGEQDLARDLLREALTLYRELQDGAAIAFTLHALGEVAMNSGDYKNAIALTEQSIAVSRERGDTNMISYSLENMARAVLSCGDVDRAEGLWKESLRLAREWDDPSVTAYSLDGLALAAGARGHASRAARLHGTADRLNKEMGLVLSPPERAIEDRFLAPARSQVDKSEWDSAENEGRSMNLEDAVAYAVEEGT